jgi:hypothetical protein
MKTVVSFSGGKTSAYMAWWLKNHTDLDLAYVFANTGQEHPKTLEFVDLCDREWGLGVVWVEAEVFHGERVASKHRVVTYETASRNGEPFEEVIKKYGLPGAGGYMHCTRELKASPIQSYVKSKYGDDYLMAIGIRADEIDRMQADADAKRIIYPLVGANPTDRARVDRFWDRQSFGLEIPPIMGNCVWCYKKSTRKHLTLIRNNPEFYDFPERMEREHSGKGSEFIFREHMTVAALKERAKKPFEMWTEASNLDLFSEMDAGCQESCEVVL